MEQAHFWSHQLLHSHCVRSQWMMVVESLRIKKLSVCIDVLHKLERPEMFQVRRCEFFANKGNFFRITNHGHYFVEFWQSTAECPADIIIFSAYQVPCKYVFRKGHSFKMWILSLNHRVQDVIQRSCFDVTFDVTFSMCNIGFYRNGTLSSPGVLWTV